MKSYDYEAVTYDCEVYCLECLPMHAKAKCHTEVYPIFADSEWDYAPTCCKCGTVHDYMNILQPKKEEEEEE